jgi:hypothetical protein
MRWWSQAHLALLAVSVLPIWIVPATAHALGFRASASMLISGGIGGGIAVRVAIEVAWRRHQHQLAARENSINAPPRPEVRDN